MPVASLCGSVMALLDPKLYSENVLVFGDGNFSFTLFMGLRYLVHRLKSSQPLCIHALSWQTMISLLRTLRNYLISKNYVETFHEVDATNLSKTFGSRVFD